MERRRWRWVGRAAVAAFLAVVVVLLVRYARRLDWAEVRGALADYDAPTLGIAAALTVASHLLYAGYDLAARRYVGHDVGTGRVAATALVSYAFNLNLGALVGGAAFRYRLYQQAGVGPADVGRVLGFSVATNWLGYALIAGVLFALRTVPLPAGWDVGRGGMQVVGVVLLLACAGYLVACARRGGRAWCVRGHEVTLPTSRLAFVQLALSAGNWLAIAAIHHTLLGGRIGFATVLGATLLAAIAAALTHIPAGVGALETVFLALLGAEVGKSAVVAALLVYRAVYYLAPLVLALGGYAALELGARRARVAAR